VLILRTYSLLGKFDVGKLRRNFSQTFIHNEAIASDKDMGIYLASLGVSIDEVLYRGVVHVNPNSL
jgi:hypothetical protein